MSFKTIMVQVDIDSVDAARVRLAVSLADRFAARLIGFAACDIHPPIASDSIVVDGQLIEEERKAIEEQMAKAKAAFAALAGEAQWRGFVGPPTWTAVAQARTADLIVSGSPRRTSAGDYYRSVDLGELILSAGRPVLVAASDAETVAAEKVLIAWNDSREARRAVRDALPFLADATDVLIATVDDPESSAVSASVGDVVDYLARHGVTARSEIISSAGGRTGERLVELGRGMGADLIVSGAYGHSRIREWVFGGVTRTLFDSPSLHRLMSN